MAVGKRKLVGWLGRIFFGGVFGCLAVLIVILAVAQVRGEQPFNSSKSNAAKRERTDTFMREIGLPVGFGIGAAVGLLWRRSREWHPTLLRAVVWRQELSDLLESRTLRNHAREVLGKAYERAVKQAATEMGAEETAFPAACPWSLEEVVPAE